MESIQKNLLIRPKNQPPAEHIVGYDHHDIVQCLNDQLLNRRVEFQEGDTDVHEGNVD